MSVYSRIPQRVKGFAFINVNEAGRNFEGPYFDVDQLELTSCRFMMYSSYSNYALKIVRRKQPHYHCVV